LNKPRVIKDYDKVDESVIAQIKLKYPHGFEKHLISFKNAKNKLVSALPHETDDRYYLIRMTADEAQNIIKEDDDFDEDGHLKADAIEELEESLEMEDVSEMTTTDDDN